MKALTVHGVWAWCIMHAGKNVENRSWTPPLSMIGKRLAIHAGQNQGDAGSQEKVREERGGPKAYPKGAILGTVVLKGFVDGDNIVGLSAKEARQISISDWASDGSCLWILQDPQPLTKPVPCKGALGLWNVPDPIATQLETAEPTRSRASYADAETRKRKRRKTSSGRPTQRGEPAASAPNAIQLDGNMRIGELEGSGYENAIAALVGSPVEVVRARLQSAPRRMKLGNAFHERWPDRHTELGNWTVAFADEREATEEIADKFGLSFSVVERRLAKAGPDTTVRKALKAK